MRGNTDVLMVTDHHCAAPRDLPTEEGGRDSGNVCFIFVGLEPSAVMHKPPDSANGASCSCDDKKFGLQSAGSRSCPQEKPLCEQSPADAFSSQPQLKRPPHIIKRMLTP